MEWTNDLAYAVGLIATDGNLSKDGRHLTLVSKDLEQICNFTNILHLKNKISKKKSGFTNEKCYFVVQFGNVKLYRFLVSIGLHSNKSKTIGKLSVPDQYFADFLRGCLDGDGYTYSYWDVRSKSSFRFYCGLTSASFDFLIWINDETSRLFDIYGTIDTCGKSAYQLVFAKHNSVALMKQLYPSDGKITYLSRKKLKIDKALGIIGQE